MGINNINFKFTVVDNKKQETSNNDKTAHLGISVVGGSIKPLPLIVSDEMTKFLEWQEYTNNLLLESTTMLGIPVSYFNK